MKIIIPFLKSIIVEASIIFIFLFLLNNFIGYTDKTIKADAIGYYDYLPSIFIYHDFIRKDIPISEDSSFYERINIPEVFVNFNDYKINKYPCGTALLQLPFFTYTYLTTDFEEDKISGYEQPFQRTVFYATIFYLFLSLFFFKKTLELFEIKRHNIILAQLFLVLATGVTTYANFDAGFSHIYSLFAITAFIYFTKSYFKERNINHFVLACLFLGLVIILRQINFLIIFFIPFLANSTNNLRCGFIHLFRNPAKLMTGIFLILGLLFIQSLLWYLQVGHFLVYSYQGEKFNFLNPEIINILFSYRKGLFVYTPILFICLISILWLAIKGKYYLAITWLLFFILITYIFSSWHVWFYGCSFGMRVYVDFYAIFFIPFTLMLNGIKLPFKLIIICISFLTIPVNIIQTYQYKEYILHWINMDKDMYWKIFLKTDDRYKGVVWKKHIIADDDNIIDTKFIGNINIPKGTDSLIWKLSSDSIIGFDKVGAIQVLIDNDFQEKNESEVILCIKEKTKEVSYWCSTLLIHFAENDFDEWQTGLYNFDFNL
ncbi:MAG: hypothetical protein K9J13_11540, partial [Saprospiraceae bacterium]|nr:hypothetical protein [Saprospiraceae bacterium]